MKNRGIRNWQFMKLLYMMYQEEEQETVLEGD
jgi:hypothetical protein